MTRFLKRLLVCAMTTAALFLSLVMPAPFSSIAFAESHHTANEIKILTREADNARSFAQDRRKQADQWQKRADRAREKAEAESDPAKKERFLKDAETYEKSVEQALYDAEGAEAKAAQAEAKIRQINAQGTPTTSDTQIPTDTEENLAQNEDSDEDSSETFKIDLEDVIGVWRFKDDAPFVIIPEEPDLEIHAYKLEAHTHNRVWRGEYSHFDEGDVRRMQDARIVLKYKPKFDEMNTEIPEWARRSVEGQLEWRLELDESGSEADPLLRIKWYPGEVRWSEGAEGDRNAKVIGDGKPRISEIEPEYAIDIEDLSQSMLSLSLGGAYDAESNPIESLIKGQRFFIKVRLPPKLAKEQGTSLTVSLKGLTGGDETTLELTGTDVVSVHRAVAYTHDKPVTIADCDIWTEPEREPQILSIPWIFGMEGACLDLDVEDGELVEVRFGESYQQVVLNNSWVQRGIARHKQGADRLRGLLGSILNGNYKKKQKEAAHKRLRMVKNYDALMASDMLMDLHRFHIGELYFSDTGSDIGIIFMEDNSIDAHWQKVRRWPDTTDSSFYNPLMQAFLEGLSGKDLELKAHTVVENLTWVSESEKMLIKKTLRRTSKRFSSDAVKTAAKKFTFGMYDGFVSSTGAGDFYLVVTGRDHFDQPLPHWMRLNAALGLASSAVLTVSGSTAAQHFIRIPVRRSVLGKTALSKTTLVARGTHGVKKIDDLGEAANLPRSIDPARRSRAHLQLEKNPPGKGSVSCSSRLKSKPKPRTIHEPGSNLDLLDFFRKEEYAKRMYGDNVKFVDEWGGPVFDTQGLTRPTCNQMSTNYKVWKKTGRRISENDGHQRIFNLMHNEVQAGKRAVGDLHSGAGFFHGYDQSSIRNYLRSLGARVAETPIAQNARIKLRHIWSALEKGWSVKVIINVPGAGMHAKHAVIIDGLEVSRSGRQVVRVRVYDPNIGQVVRVPARDFDRIINRTQTDYGVLTLFRFD